MLKEIVKRNWDFILFEDGNEKIITVVFFDKAIDYTRSFYLTEEEFSLDVSVLANLSVSIRNNYESFKDREILPSITSEN